VKSSLKIKLKNLNKLFYVLLIYIVALVFLVQIVFYFFSENIFKPIIKEKVYNLSSKLYSVEFDDIRINFIKNKLYLTNVVLTPDTSLYSELIKNENYNNPLYEIKLDTFFIDNLSVINLLKKSRTLKVETIEFNKPYLKLITVGNQKKEVERKNEFEVAKKDLLPLLFRFFNSLEIDKIILKNGFFDFLILHDSSGETFSADNITLILNNFDITRSDFLRDEEVLYTNDIELKIEGYELKMKDKIHILSASNIYISTLKKMISLDNATLSPNQLDTFSLDTISENYFNISIPKIELLNADFENLYLNKIIDLQAIKINNADLKLYRKKHTIDTLKTKIDLYKIIEGNLEYINIDTFTLDSAKLSVYDNIKNKFPRTSISSVTLNFYNFAINSQNVNNLDKILGAENVTLEINNFEHNLKDNVHVLSSEKLSLNSNDKSIHAINVSLLPKNKLFSSIIYQNINKIIVPEISLTGVDIIRFYNYYDLIINNLVITNPILNIISYSSDNKDFKRTGDNFQDNLTSLTKEYLKGIKINNLNLIFGKFSFQKNSLKKQTVTSGNLNVTLNNFAFNPNLPVTKLLSAENIDILFTNYKLSVPESFHVLSIDSFEISTFKEGLFFKNIKIQPTENSELYSEMKNNNKSILLNLQIPNLQILETNLQSSLLEDSLTIKNIDIPNANVEITILSGNKEKTQKLQNIQSLKYKAIVNINKTVAKNKIESFLNIIQIDSTNLIVVKQKQKIIDSIQSFALSSINKLIINPKNININDTTYQALIDIESSANEAINNLSNNNLSDFQNDSIFKLTISKISYVNNSNDKNVIEKEEIYDLVGSFLNVIDIDKVSINDGILIFNNYVDSEEKEIFHNSFSINFYDFYFNHDSISSTNRFLFSKNIDIKIEDYVLNLKDNIHKVLVKQLELSTERSEIILNSISISPFTNVFTQNSNKLYAFCPKAVFTNIDLNKIYEEQKVEIQKLYLKKPLVTIIQNGEKVNDSTASKKLTQVLLPSNIKTLKISELEIDTGKIKFIDSKNITEKTVFQSDFNIDISNFLIDSVTYVSNNVFLIPIENLNLQFFNFKYNLNDNIHFVKADNLIYTSENSIVKANNFQISYNKSDTAIVSKLILKKKNNLIDLMLPEFEISNVDIKKIIKNHELTLDDIILKNSEISIHSFTYLKSDNDKPFNIEDFDLYQLIKPVLNKFESEKIIFTNSKFLYYSHKKEIVDTIILENINGKITGLVVDSISRQSRSKFLFADDISIKIEDFSKLIDDSLYTFKTAEFGISTKNSKIFITDFEIVPNYDKSKFSQDLFGYQKSVMDISGRTIEIQGFDIVSFLNDKKIIAKKIILDGIVFDFYKDMHPMINDTIVPVNPMDNLRNIKKYIKIDTVLISNSKLSYEQLAANKTETGILTLEQINGYAINITNDSNLIANNTILIADIYTKLMGTGNTHITINLPLNSENNYHEIEGTIEDMNATDLNAFTTNAFSASISNGFIKKLHFKIKGNDSISSCVMRMNYENLAVNIWDIDSTQQIKKRSFLSFIINKAVIRQNNPKYGVFFQKGDVIFIHDKNRQFLYNWLQPILKAVTATIAGKETANMVENILAKVQIKNQRRKEEKIKEKMIE